jgi:hypothetical protein
VRTTGRGWPRRTGFLTKRDRQLFSAISHRRRDAVAPDRDGGGFERTVVLWIIFDTDQLNIGGGNIINGNIGVGNGANLNNSDPATITNGNIFVDTFTTGGTVNGTTFTNQNLSQARTDALALSATAAGLAPTGTIATSNTTQIITPGVYDFTTLQLNNNHVWTLNGSGDYMFNISTSLSVGHFAIVLTNGATASNSFQ